MDATPTDFLARYAEHAVPHDGEPPSGDPSSPLALKWTALETAAEVVASLAEIRTKNGAAAAQALAAGIERAGGWRLALARQSVDDIAAMMEPGIAALLAVHAQGGDPRPPALALWQEFDRARQALLTLARSGQETG